MRTAALAPVVPVHAAGLAFFTAIGFSPRAPRRA